MSNMSVYTYFECCTNNLFQLASWPAEQTGCWELNLLFSFAFVYRWCIQWFASSTSSVGLRFSSVSSWETYHEPKGLDVLDSQPTCKRMSVVESQPKSVIKCVSILFTWCASLIAEFNFWFTFEKAPGLWHGHKPESVQSSASQLHSLCVSISLRFQF